jgi:pullulanase
MDYGGQPAGYASEPGETVNYVENHDNQTLYDANALKLPLATSTPTVPACRCWAGHQRLQPGRGLFPRRHRHPAFQIAGPQQLQFRRLVQPPRLDLPQQLTSAPACRRRRTTRRTGRCSSRCWPTRPCVRSRKTSPFTRDAFRDLLAIRASSTLFRLRTADEVAQRLRFFNVGPQQEASVIAAHLDGRGHPGANFAGITYFINVDKVAHVVSDAQARGKRLRLHPVHTVPAAGDKRAVQARFDNASGSFTIPARTAVVFVEE